MTATRTLSSSLQSLTRTLLDDPAADAELVGRFAARRDADAFAALVRRYGGVVFGVCRRVLRHEQDAEDAFQATFLVLARHAARLERSGAVGNWLYGVAHNVSRKARARRHRRTLKEQQAARGPHVEPTEPDDLRGVLDAELAALPDKYRTAVVLCELRGLTTQQAAAEVGCPPKTLGTRLLRGRALLAQRLTRRGVAPCLAGLVPVVVPPRLVAAAASSVATNAAVPPAVAALVPGASTAMLKSTFKYALVATVVGLTAAPVWHHLHAAPRPAATGATPPATRPASNPFALLRVLHDILYRPVRGLLHAADDKKEKDAVELSGTWTKKDGEMKLSFGKGELKISPHGKDDVILVVCEYTADKKGLVKAKVTSLEGSKKGALEPKFPVGTEFTFTWKVTKDTAKADDVKCEKTDLIKSPLEGDYEAK